MQECIPALPLQGEREELKAMSGVQLARQGYACLVHRLWMGESEVCVLQQGIGRAAQTVRVVRWWS